MVCAEYVANGQNAPALSDADDTDTDEDVQSAQSDYIEMTEPPANAPATTQSPVGTVQCSVGQQFCYSVWRLDAIGNATIIRQGCWQSDERQSACQSVRCISGSPNSVSNSHRFCCCSGAMCNQNTTIIETIQRQTTWDSSGDDASDGSAAGPFTASQIASLWRSPLVWVCLIVTGVLMVAVGALLAVSSGKKYVAEMGPLQLSGALTDAVDAAMGDGCSGPGYSSTAQSVDNLRLSSMIGRGRYGTVWQGIVNERPVAVKIFPAQHRQYFVNERNIYSLALMDSPSLLEYYGKLVNGLVRISSIRLMGLVKWGVFLGSDTRRTMNDQVEHLLILSLAPHGCLQDWLIENSCSFATFTRMAKSVIRGLSHLHTEMRVPGGGGGAGESEKPCVCHRDLNTRNILVKADGSCCIADFGFALKMYGSRYEWKGEIAQAETKSVAEVSGQPIRKLIEHNLNLPPGTPKQVGTLRYMAPEVLEGAVNLRECETALKQIDVYALGLVLWELCTRCADWYPADVETPAYQAPYEAEVGKHPSFEQMQILVARHKVRPSFAAAWGGAAASARLARETCEDCWDHDSEARLTSLCAEERMLELSVLGPTAQSSRPISPNGGAAVGVAHIQKAIASAQQHDQVSAIDSCNMFQSNVTTAIITPPNQIIPERVRNDAAKVVTITTRPLDYQYQQPTANYNHYGHDGANSVEELLSSVSVSGDGSHTDKSDTTASGAAKSASPRGWFGVRALIQKNLFKRKPASAAPLASNNDTIANDSLGTLNVVRLRSPLPIVPDVATHSPPLAVQLRPRNLGLDHQMQPEPVATTLPRTAVRSADHQRHHHSAVVEPPVDTDRSVSCTRINYPLAHEPTDADDCSSLALCSSIALPSNAERQRMPRIVISKSATTVLQPTVTAVDVGSTDESSTSSASLAELRQMKRQRSLDMFHEVFGAKGSIERLRDPAQRVKTPGDVPAAVRRMRASKTLSLYDDRMMDGAGGGLAGSPMSGATAAEAMHGARHELM